MNISDSKKNEILEKRLRLADVKKQLKSEFAGIDNVIDELIDSFCPWYIFPEFITKPIVVNLWGLTGSGKTSLIRRLVEELSLEDSFVHIDVAEFNDRFNSTLKGFFTDELLHLNKNNCMLCLDEFQYAKTLDENGAEIDKKGARQIWELLDTGIIEYYPYRPLADISYLTHAFKDCLNQNIRVKKGKVIEKKEAFYLNSKPALNIYNPFFIASHYVV